MYCICGANQQDKNLEVTGFRLQRIRLQRTPDSNEQIFLHRSKKDMLDNPFPCCFFFVDLSFVSSFVVKSLLKG